jgi:hypothetical protein
MRKKIIFILFLFCLFSVYSQDISLFSVKGTVKIKTDEKSSWAAVKEGQKLSTGNFIFTGFDSEAIIKTVNSKIQVKALSQASVASLIATKENIVTDVYVKYGKVTANVEKNTQLKTEFKVRSANSTASVRGTIFTFGNNNLFVEEGTVQLDNEYDNSALIQKGERANVKMLDVIEPPYSFLNSSYFQNILPIGVSDSEMGGGVRDPISRMQGKFLFRTKATVVITIDVIY